MKKLFTIFILASCEISSGQNLVPNPSFEELNWCPIYPDDLFALQGGWTSFGGTPDVYNACNTDSLIGVPRNFVGYQEPASGNGYGGLMIYDNTFWREYYATRLTNILTQGVKYYSSIRVSLAECSHYASNNLGIGFLTDSFQITFLTPQDSLTHYVKINSSTIISDATSWTIISGSFIADSAYKYIVIGNFYDYRTTDTLFRNNTCPYALGYYYIDDVCVSTDSLTCNSPVGIQQPKQNTAVSLFPNPFSTQLTFSLLNNEPATIILYDIFSRQILQQAFTNSTTINTEQFAEGIYFYELRNDRGMVGGGKVVKHP